MQLSMCEAKHGIFCKKNWITNSSLSTTVDLWIDLSRGILIIWNTWFLPFYIWFLLFWLAEHVYSIRFKNVCQQVFKNILIFFKNFLKAVLKWYFVCHNPTWGVKRIKNTTILNHCQQLFLKNFIFFTFFLFFCQIAMFSSLKSINNVLNHCFCIVLPFNNIYLIFNS